MISYITESESDENMIEEIVNKNLKSYQQIIKNIEFEKVIDCITIFSKDDKDYEVLNENAKKIGKIIDKMNSGNLYFLQNKIETEYGILEFVKIRKPDKNYFNYRISVDFYLPGYHEYKNNIKNPTVKKYETFELIQLKDETTILNIVSVSAREDYKIK